VGADRLADDLRHRLPQLKPGVGPIVREVLPGTAAAKAGVERFDILVSWNDQMLVHPGQLQVLVENAKTGEPIQLEFLHRGKLTKSSVVLDSRPEPAIPGHRHPWRHPSMLRRAVPPQAAEALRHDLPAQRGETARSSHSTNCSAG
jgi:hypothetical protein